MLLMMVALSVCMASCSDDDDDPVQQVVEEETGLVGTWKSSDSSGAITYRFNKDGSGSRTLDLFGSGSSTSSTVNFLYTLESGVINGNIGGAIHHWSYTLTGNTLMLRDDISGDRWWVLVRQ